MVLSSKSIENLNKSCSKHGLVSIELSILVELLLMIFGRVHDSNNKKIGIVCSRNIISKLSTLVRIINVYLYKSSAHDYIADCKEISLIIKKTRHDISLYSTEYSTMHCDKLYYSYGILQKIESVIKQTFKSIEIVINNKKVYIETAKKIVESQNLPNIIDNYFTNIFPKDKDAIYAFIDEFS